MRNKKDPVAAGRDLLFDTENCGWWHRVFAPNALRLLDSGVEGIFRRSILKLMPVGSIEERFHPSEGRPSKELFAMCGLLLLAEFYDWTVDRTAHEWTFSNAVQYALNLPGSQQYLSPRSVDEYRKLLRESDSAQETFERVTSHIVGELELNIKKQRLDSTHVFSNMAQLGRLELFGTTIKGFLHQLRRHHWAEFDALPEALTKRYEPVRTRLFGMGTKDARPRQEALQQAAEDLGELLARFGENERISQMRSFLAMGRVFAEQCEFGEQGAIVVTVKALDENEKSSNVLQNPSDPTCGFSGHKGPGYQAQLAQAHSMGEEGVPGIIVGCHVESAGESDANAPEKIIEQQERMQTKPDELVADTLYGSQSNVELAKTYGVTLIAPTPGKTGVSTPPELKARREAEESEEFKKTYAARNGIEGLNSALKRTTHFGQLRVRGIAAVKQAIFGKVIGWNIRTAVKILNSRARRAKLAQNASPSAGKSPTSTSKSRPNIQISSSAIS
jgi:hypothetical protein